MTHQEALDIFKCLAWHDLRPSEEEIEMAFETLNDKPTGKWIPHIGMNHQCSVCGAYFPLSEFKTRPFRVNYCIECGARLESEDKE